MIIMSMTELWKQCMPSPHHRHGLTFFLYFFVNIKHMMLPSFSFIEADLAKCHLLIGVLDGGVLLCG